MKSLYNAFFIAKYLFLCGNEIDQGSFFESSATVSMKLMHEFSLNLPSCLIYLGKSTQENLYQLLGILSKFAKIDLATEKEIYSFTKIYPVKTFWSSAYRRNVSSRIFRLYLLIYLFIYLFEFFLLSFLITSDNWPFNE